MIDLKINELINSINENMKGKIKYNLQFKTDKWINFNDKLYNLETGYKKLEKLKKKFPTKEFRLKQIKITKF